MPRSGFWEKNMLNRALNPVRRRRRGGKETMMILYALFDGARLALPILRISRQ
jgi:hypothetical protein